MAEVITIARPYADAVFKSAMASGTLSIWSDMLRLLAAITEDNRIKQLIDNPIVSAKQLKELFLDICGDRLNDKGRNLILLLIENNRVEILSHISILFEQLKAAHEGVLEAKIVSAFAISDNQLNQLVAGLERKFKRKIEVKVSVDPELIGGVKVEIGDEILDASVRGKLETMAIALKS
ncbi:ATP synthase F1 subcomplex delta subunit [Nitrosomonas cryotolerans]|uniref:ATP synthase subunit delta n=1 Tax=Nitrosomonas cryotolerans ATCC 49181 TaxID=1131553 RepID=A0A1N6FGI0_9PROT|nr:F0F1 ATP synthase subunit delta [Nitrosomonas cryotolerans]SFP62968.1 ATP synthase F1 subcomplex delta subunit [Nitrosomonas cryotolerans]SIN94354.1 ATP synthase F1 subcomplex delta subunit [Nitrosomonas cryotolerans ATCC 49181]